ncbi:hypothetical protein GCM10011386_01070 [Parapedobacter defluvii]|uniref:Uncharacterized protein n=1 Tax=Parapedobacter defluvii TaxID=2045106 RepID=A0ABQ1L0A2_9SPHI|nr:hypothetical protein [Parapedobacter defluvii]GGC13224.1 hypothetical protein GCM10011386_01070 [Parapedobacter defluvii]
MKNTLIFILLFGITTLCYSQSFEIRGVLPWHNFLSGPSAWNAQDYEKYLDECQKKGINFIAFHNYTGGGERYFNYVEPMVKIQYKNVLPETGFDHSGMARWGYLPMKVNEFAYGTDKLFRLPGGVKYFGADCSVLANTNEERYKLAQSLMQNVLEMAHARGMQMAMGFEFGVAPPEYASIRTRGDMYWLGHGSIVYNPFDPDATGILYATIDNILETYQGIDWIYLWLNEHCMFGIDPAVALKNQRMKAFFDENGKYFESEAIDDNLKFLGVWAQAYIQKAYDYIKRKAPDTKIVIGGWGAEYQMGLLLQGLDKVLPKDVVFSMLNPAQGAKPHPGYFKAIAANRRIWAIPWLEGDYSLWHLQPRVQDMRAHVKKAADDGLNGVVGIHWRTAEIAANFEAFAHFAVNPVDDRGVETIYRDHCLHNYGVYAAKYLAPLLASNDTSKILSGIQSDVYFAYTPAWGRLTHQQVKACNVLINTIDDCLLHEKGKDHLANLTWLKANYEFTLLLDEVSRSMEPAWKIREEILSGIAGQQEEQDVSGALERLREAPIERLFTTYASRVRSRGELGVLSSLNQRIWREYGLLNDFLQQLR